MPRVQVSTLLLSLLVCGISYGSAGKVSARRMILEEGVSEYTVEVKQGMLVTVDAGFGVDLGSCDDILTALAAISEHEAVDATLKPEGCEFNYFTQTYEFMLGASAEDVDALMKMHKVVLGDAILKAVYTTSDALECDSADLYVDFVVGSTDQWTISERIYACDPDKFIVDGSEPFEVVQLNSLCYPCPVPAGPPAPAPIPSPPTVDSPPAPALNPPSEDFPPAPLAPAFDTTLRVTLFNTNDTKLVEELCGDLTDMLVTILTVLAEAENATAPSANSTSCTAIQPAGSPVYALEVDVVATVAIRFLTAMADEEDPYELRRNTSLVLQQLMEENNTTLGCTSQLMIQTNVADVPDASIVCNPERFHQDDSLIVVSGVGFCSQCPESEWPVTDSEEVVKEEDASRKRSRKML